MLDIWNMVPAIEAPHFSAPKPLTFFVSCTWRRRSFPFQNGFTRVGSRSLCCRLWVYWWWKPFCVFYLDYKTTCPSVIKILSIVDPWECDRHLVCNTGFTFHWSGYEDVEYEVEKEKSAKTVDSRPRWPSLLAWVFNMDSLRYIDFCTVISQHIIPNI